MRAWQCLQASLLTHMPALAREHGTEAPAKGTSCRQSVIPVFLVHAHSTASVVNVHRNGGRVDAFGITLNLDADYVDHHTAELSFVAWRFDFVGRWAFER
jgi:hypothetical protein